MLYTDLKRSIVLPKNGIGMQSENSPNFHFSEDLGTNRMRVVKYPFGLDPKRAEFITTCYAVSWQSLGRIKNKQCSESLKKDN